jgi:hypothetical protein
MRSHLITTAVAIAAIALSGCPDKRGPVPAPQSASAPQSSPSSVPQPGHAPADAEPGRGAQPAAAPRGANEISWFQGTFEEAFARSRRHGGCPLLRY